MTRQGTSRLSINPGLLAVGVIEIIALAYFLPTTYPLSLKTFADTVSHLAGPAKFDSRVWTQVLLPVTLALVITLCAVFVAAPAGSFRLLLKAMERVYTAKSWWVKAPLFAFHLFSLWMALRCSEAILNERSFLQGPGRPSDYFFLLWFGILSVLSFLFLHAIDVATFRWFIPRFSLAISLSGAMIYAGLYASFFVWPQIGRLTLIASGRLLSFFFNDVVIDEVLYKIGTGNFKILLAYECSGVEGIVVYSLFLAIFLVTFRRELRFPRAFLLFPLGTVAMWLSNIVRIAILVALGAAGSQRAAFNGFHSAAGWIFFDLMGLATAVLALRSAWFSKAPRSLLPLRNNLVASFLLPLVGILAVQFFSKPFTFQIDLLYPLRVFVVVLALWLVRDSGHYLRLGGVPVVAIFWGAVAFFLWLWLDPNHGGPVVEKPWAQYPFFAAALWVGFRFFGSVVTTPIAEELAFRGYLLRRLVAADFSLVPMGTFTLLSCLASSALFGMMHSRPLAGTSAGICFCAALYHRKKLSDAVVAHMTTNAMLALFALATGRWGAWL